MAFYRSTSELALYRFMGLAWFLTVLLLILLAYRGWAKRVRKDLPRWRSALGIASIAATFLNWLGFVVLALAVWLRMNVDFLDLLPVDWTDINLLISAAGTLTALALKGPSRVQAFLAGLLMTALWFTSIVE